MDQNIGILRIMRHGDDGSEREAELVVVVINAYGGRSIGGNVKAGVARESIYFIHTIT